MSLLTRKEAKKLKGKYYGHSDGKTTYLFKVKKVHKTFTEGIKIVLTPGFTSLVMGVIAIDNTHTYRQITKDEFNVVFAKVNELKGTYID